MKKRLLLVLALVVVLAMIATALVGMMFGVKV